MDSWISMLHIPEFRELVEHATSKSVQMPTLYLYEHGFSSLILIKRKKNKQEKNRNAILNLDPRMRIAMENRLRPRVTVIAEKIITILANAFAHG